MENIARKKQIENEEVTLAQIFGVSPDSLLVVTATAHFGEHIKAGDLLFVDSQRKPQPSDLILYDKDGEISVKKFSAFKDFQPLRLVARNGEPVKSQEFSNLKTLFGVITHIARGLEVVR